MAIIDNHITVKFGEDGELVFKHPGKRAFVALQSLSQDEDGKPLPEEEQAKRLFEMLVEVKNLSKVDGTPVSKESLLAGDWNDAFVAAAVRGLTKELLKLFGVEDSAAKNG